MNCWTVENFRNKYDLGWSNETDGTAYWCECNANCQYIPRNEELIFELWYDLYGLSFYYEKAQRNCSP